VEKLLLRIITFFLLIASLCSAAAQRIVSTSPSITETLFAMGLGSRVVGVTIYCDYPPAALKLPKIGTLLKPDVEVITALHPDLVVVEKTPNHLPEQLAHLHLHYVEYESLNLETIYAGMRAIGKAADVNPAAEKLIGEMQTAVEDTRRRTAGLPKPTVAFLVGHTGNRLEGLIAGAAHSYFSNLISIAGGADTFADSAAPYPTVSLEEILSRNPDFILELSSGNKEQQEQVIRLWKEHTALRAVTNGHIYPIPPGPFLIPGPRVTEALRTLVHLLHPDLPQ
jgi:iron complex transport system substrate-binding protein